VHLFALAHHRDRPPLDSAGVVRGSMRDKGLAFATARRRSWLITNSRT